MTKNTTKTLLTRFGRLQRSLSDLNRQAMKTLTQALQSTRGRSVTIRFWNDPSPRGGFPYDKVYDQCLEDDTVTRLTDGRLFLPVRVSVSPSSEEVELRGYVISNRDYDNELTTVPADLAESVEPLITFIQEYS